MLHQNSEVVNNNGGNEYLATMLAAAASGIHQALQQAPEGETAQYLRQWLPVIEGAGELESDSGRLLAVLHLRHVAQLAADDLQGHSGG